ncbi:DUF4378 domain-containing protein [Melia azedarach]|uniref:DUF4378 domain-containing protein n=1 Tax=Melia azedarach TaxID=155640 RepID=A0ACC1XXE6_MELAZ|nr:DUF4378 domain-containing protein [Melia azedarach]
MATCPFKPVPMKKLKDHLQEQQDPFKLSSYLSERRYSMKKLSSGSENNRSSSNSMTNQKEPCSSSSRKKTILLAPGNLKSLLYKLITPGEKQELSSCNKAVKEKLVSETINMIQQIAETNWFSAVSNVTPCSASSDQSDYCASEHWDGLLVAEATQVWKVRQSEEGKTTVDAHQPWSCKEDDNQLSPITYAFLLKSLVKSLTEKHNQVGWPEVKETVLAGSSKSQRNKRVLLPQSKRLLLDCIKRSILHNVQNNERQKHLHKLLSLEELGKIISRQLCAFGKQLGDATNAARLKNLDFSSTPEEWNCFRQTKVQICREMGDSIIDEIIDEIIDLQ